MKYLTLIRHAEAAQPFGVSDFDRALSSYGAEKAPILGRRLEQQGFMPDVVYVSPAARTQETAKILCYEIGFPVEDLSLQDSIYRASLKQLMLLLQDVEEDCEHLMLVGHNPALSDLAQSLCGRKAGVPSHMSTCSMVRMALPIDYWALIEEGCADFIEYDTPENMS